MADDMTLTEQMIEDFARYVKDPAECREMFQNDIKKFGPIVRMHEKVVDGYIVAREYYYENGLCAELAAANTGQRGLPPLA